MKYQIKAFTLIELLVTVALVGILSAMALAQFQIYKSKANDSVAMASVANALIAVQSLFASNNDINGTITIDGDGSIVQTNPAINLPGFQHQAGAALWINLGSDVPGSDNPGETGSKGAYRIWGAHCNGSVVQIFSGYTIVTTYEATNIKATTMGKAGAINNMVGGGGLIREDEMRCSDGEYY